MDELIEELKAKARRQHRASADDSQRRHHLAELARRLGFEGWPHLVAVLSGSESKNFGTLLYAPRCATHLNIWSASYEEAQMIRAEHGGFLLPYKHQFMIVDDHFIETLGLDPSASEWLEMGRDWIEPRSTAARSRLCGAAVRARLRSR